MQTKLTSPLKWHGGKYYLAKEILALLPSHLHYVEPYFGGGQVLFRKDPEGVSEVANDLNGHLMNFWNVLKDPRQAAAFHSLVEATPFAEAEFQEATALLAEFKEATAAPAESDPVRRAWALFVVCRQSLAGRLKSFTGVTKTRTRRGMNNEVSAWLTVREGLPAVTARLQRVLLLNRPALEVIHSQDSPDTLFYLDPPYLHETRKATDVYVCEMSAAEHQKLLDTILQVIGKVMLSGCASKLYDDALQGWKRETFDLPNNAAGGSEKSRQTEVLWMNF